MHVRYGIPLTVFVFAKYELSRSREGCFGGF